MAVKKFVPDHAVSEWYPSLTAHQTPKGSYSAKTGVNCTMSLSRHDPAMILECVWVISKFNAHQHQKGHTVPKQVNTFIQISNHDQCAMGSTSVLLCTDMQRSVIGQSETENEEQEQKAKRQLVFLAAAFEWCWSYGNESLFRIPWICVVPTV